jgi:hypothetical protein
MHICSGWLATEHVHCVGLTLSARSSPRRWPLAYLDGRCWELGEAFSPRLAFCHDGCPSTARTLTARGMSGLRVAFVLTPLAAVRI